MQQRHVHSAARRCDATRFTAHNRPLVGRAGQSIQVSATKDAEPCSPAWPRRAQLLASFALLAIPGVSNSAAAETIGQVAIENSSTGAEISSGTRVYLDVKVEQEPAGRIVIALFDDVKTGAARFKDLAIGQAGVGYRLSRFDRVVPEYIRNAGVSSLSYSATQASLIAGGDSVQDLEEELAGQTRSHSEAGLVSILVKEAVGRPVKERLVARDGKLVTRLEQAGEAPNGTMFSITRQACPDLDKTQLIVGKVVSGMDVIEKIGQLPVSRPRESWYDGPFFKAGKALGDKRADVAEKFINRPLARVIISKAGLA